MTEQHAEMSVSIANDLAEIATVISTFEGFAESSAVPPMVTTRFVVIFDELLSNIIYYGYTDRDRHQITVAMRRQGSRLNITIIDDGTPFDPLEATSPNENLPLEQREVGGLGIHLVRNLVHEIQYRRENGRNVLTLIQELE